MPKSRSHQPTIEFTTTSMKLRREIRDVLLPQITDISMLKQPAPGLVTSRTFHVNVSQLDPSTFRVDVQYRSAHIGSTAAQLHLKASATELSEAIEALLASLSDGWVWQVE
ncbi:MAG: hypothetical protein ONB06_04765 [candidate division KSB1 bacterium]|nr:hypothetical protein [candidate division KSB1 bacterium]